MKQDKKTKIKVNRPQIIFRVVIILLIILTIYFIQRGISESNYEYEIPVITDYKYFLIIEDEKYGVIDKEGNTLIDTIYDEIVIPNPEEDVVVCYVDGTAKVTNTNSEELFTKYDQVEAIRLKNIVTDLMYEKTVLKYKDGDKWGLIDYEGKIITKAKYDSIQTLEYKEGEMIITEDGKQGVINVNGKVVVEPEYDTIQTDKYYTIEEGQKNAGYVVSITTDEGYRMGYLNKRGDVYLDAEYTSISRIIEFGNENEAYLMVAKDGQYGLYKNGTQLSDFLYKTMRYDVKNEVLIVERAKKIGAIGKNGKVIIDASYMQIDVNGAYLYAKDDNYEVTIYNLKGEVQENQSEDEYFIEINGKEEKIKINSADELVYSIVDSNGASLTTEKYNYMNYLFDDNYMVTMPGGKIGIISSDEDIKVEIKYDSLERLLDNNLLIVISNEEGIVQMFNKELEEIATMDYKNFQYVDMGEYVKLYNNTDTIYITKAGEVIANTDLFDYEIYPQKNEDGSWSVIDKSGNVITDETYDKILEMNNYGYLAIKQDDKWGCIDRNGSVVVEPIYKISGYKEPSFIGEFYKVEYGFAEVYYTNKIVE